jgi:preprotein translocase subunit SecF
MMQIFKNPNFDFVKFRHKAFMFSGLCIAITIGAFVYNKGFNLAIDFVGGTLVHVKFEKPVENDIATIRSVVGNLGYGSAEVKTMGFTGKGNEVQITVKKKAELGLVGKEIKEVLSKALPNNHFEVLQEEKVGAKVSNELGQKALIAILLSWIAILIYMAFRFKVSYGVGAIVALIHDVIITTGVFLIHDAEISLNFVAAILTVIGYSINDTIVIFDRIRENNQSAVYSGKSLEERINISVNQTLSRSIITVLTVFMVVSVFFFVGGDATRDLSLAMMAGTFFGAYSSIFIASPILIYWNRKWPIKK